MDNSNEPNPNERKMAQLSTLPTLPTELCLKILYEFKGLTTPTAELIKPFINFKNGKISALKREQIGLIPFDEDGATMFRDPKNGIEYDSDWHDDFIWELENDCWSYPDLNEENTFLEYTRKLEESVEILVAYIDNK